VQLKEFIRRARDPEDDGVHLSHSCMVHMLTSLTTRKPGIVTALIPSPSRGYMALEYANEGLRERCNQVLGDDRQL
jgi:hypothetical protein